MLFKIDGCLDELYIIGLLFLPYCFVGDLLSAPDEIQVDIASCCKYYLLLQVIDHEYLY